MRRAAQNAALVAAALVVGALLIEGGLRLAGLSYPVFMRADDRLGWAFAPGTEGWSVQEGMAWVSINRHGFRGPDWAVDKPADAIRVAVLGDSFAEASNVAFDASFPQVMERRLADCPAAEGRNVEVMNFGVSGYGTDQAKLVLEEAALDFAPDVVVLAFFTGNDVANNHPALFSGEQTLKPYFALDDGALVIDRSFLDDPAYRERKRRTRWLGGAINVSYLAQNLKQAVRGRHRLPGDPPALPRFDPARHRGEEVKPNSPETLVPPEPGTPWEEAWTRTEALIANMAASARETGAMFLLAVIPDPAAAYPGAQGRAAIAARAGLDGLGYAERRLARMAAFRGVATLTLRRPMIAAQEAQGRFFYGFDPEAPGNGHWNEAGNRFGGRAIAETVCGMLGG